MKWRQYSNCLCFVTRCSPSAGSLHTDGDDQKQQINHKIMHTVALSVLLKVEVNEPLSGHRTSTSVPFLSLTRQNRCPQFMANIPSFSFPHGKVPFSLPAWGKSTKATAILDYSLVNRLYLFQFSLQIVFPCPKVKWDVLGQPQGCFELRFSWLFTALLVSYSLTV